MPPVLAGITPAFLMDDTGIDPTIFRVRKLNGDIEIVDNLTNVVLRSLLSTETPQSVSAITDQGIGTKLALSDHVHQGVHSVKADGYGVLYGDITFSFGDGLLFTQTANAINMDADLSNTPALDVGDASSQGSSNQLSRAGHQHVGLHSLSKQGSSQLFGDITLQAGNNMTITLANQGVVLSQSGVGGPLPTFFNLPNPLPVTSGGTGFNSYTVGDLLVANSTTTLAQLHDVAVGNVLLSGGVNQMPFWGKANLAQHFIGFLSYSYIEDIATAGLALQTTPTGVAYGLLDLANTTGNLTLSKLTNDAVADKPLLSGGPSADPHYGSLPSGSVTGRLGITQIPNGTVGMPLIGGGAGSPPDPSYSPLNLPTAASTTGTLPLTKGGTGATTISATNQQIMVVNGAGTALQGAGAPSNGSILIGRTGLTPVMSTITAGSGINITNAAGSISISSTGGGSSVRDLHECRLVLDGANLRLRPYNGNFLTLSDGVIATPRAFSGDGPTLSTTGTTAATSYYVFAYWDGSNIQLELQQPIFPFSFTLDVIWPTGTYVATKAANPSRRFVGLAHTDIDGNWKDQEDKRYVWSYFNQRLRFARTYLQVAGDPAAPAGNWSLALLSPIKILCAPSLWTVFNPLDIMVPDGGVHVDVEVGYYNNTATPRVVTLGVAAGVGTSGDTVFSATSGLTGNTYELTPTTSEIRYMYLSADSPANGDFAAVHTYPGFPLWLVLQTNDLLPKLISQGMSVNMTATYMG